MKWDREIGKYVSLHQQRRHKRQLGDAMALFRKKVEDMVSVFDNLPSETQAKLIDDVLAIVRTVKQWPIVVPQNFHGPIGNEVLTLVRKSGLKLAGVFLGAEDIEKGLGEVFKDMKMPTFISQVIIAVKLALAEPSASQDKDPNGTAA